MDLGLKGKKAAILASSTGIGFAIAEALAAEGASIALSSHNEKNLKEALKQLPHAKTIVLDLDQPGSGREFTERARDALGGIDILVTNAGGPPKGDFCELTQADWEKGYRQLWQSATESILAVLPHMKQQRFGRILLSTSTAAKEPIPHLTISSAFRAGLLGLMKTLSHEVASDQITVNAILPGYTRTKRMEAWGQSLDVLAKDIPAHRLAEPWEIGALAAFLASTQAAYITGQAIACDGGLLAGI